MKRQIKRVAYLLDVFPQTSETFIINEIAEVKTKGIEVKIFSRKKPKECTCHEKAKTLAKGIYYFSEKNLSNSAKAFSLHLYFLFSSPKRYIKTFIFALKRRRNGLLWYFKQSVVYAYPIKKSKADHIHSHYSTNASEYAMLISMLLGIPFTFTAHGWWDIYTYPPADFYDRGQWAKKVITVSEYNKDYIHRTFKIPREKVEVIHCGIDTSFFTPIKKPQPKKDNIILSVGRLSSVKGFAYLTFACSILKQRRNSFHCMIIGEGEERHELEELIRIHGLDEVVQLLGAKPQSEIIKYHQRARLFVLPSVFESMGVATMEAMACGLPVIATEVWGVPELVEDGKNGFLVPPKDPEALAEKMERLLLDPDLCQRFGREGRKKVEREFNLKTEVNKLIKIWME